jgi:hypothetical protein
MNRSVVRVKLDIVESKDVLYDVWPDPINKVLSVPFVNSFNFEHRSSFAD